MRADLVRVHSGEKPEAPKVLTPALLFAVLSPGLLLAVGGKQYLEAQGREHAVEHAAVLQMVVDDQHSSPRPPVADDVVLDMHNGLRHAHLRQINAQLEGGTQAWRAAH